MTAEKVKARKELVEKRNREFNELPADLRDSINTNAKRLRTSFGDSADWVVWGEKMVPWEELPEENRQNWRAVVQEAGI